MPRDCYWIREMSGSWVLCGSSHPYTNYKGEQFYPGLGNELETGLAVPWSDSSNHFWKQNSAWGYLIWVMHKHWGLGIFKKKHTERHTHKYSKSKINSPLFLRVLKKTQNEEGAIDFLKIFRCNTDKGHPQLEAVIGWPSSSWLKHVLLVGDYEKTATVNLVCWWLTTMEIS